MNTNPGLVRRIVLSVLALFAFHGVVFLVLWLSFKLPVSSMVYWCFGAAALHAALMGFLLVLKDSFYYLKDQSPMKSMGLANLLSMFRITSAPSIVVLLMSSGGRSGLIPWLLAYIVLAFVSDFLDGWVSRSSGTVSRIGQYLDSSSDYVVLILFSFFFSWLQVIHQWFFWVVLARFTLQWVMVGILFLSGRRGEEVAATFLGKASVFATMTIFVLALASLALFSWAPKLGISFTLIMNILTVCEVLVSALLAVSLVEKILVFMRGIRRA